MSEYDHDDYEGYAGDGIDEPADFTANYDQFNGYVDEQDRDATHTGTSATGEILDNLALYRSTSTPLSPVRGDPDPRDVDDMGEQLAHLERAIDGVVDAWAPEGSPLAGLRDEIHWGIVNTLHQQSFNLHRDMTTHAMYLRDMVGVTTDSEVTDQQILEKTEITQKLYDHVGAFERLHSAAAYHYLRRTGKPWRPYTRGVYNGTQEDFRGSISTGQAAARAARDARRPLVFAGIGSRQTPPEAQAVMAEIARELAGHGATLRSGAARGADQAFERGADRAGGAKEIFIPEEGFQRRSDQEEGVTADIPDRAFEIAEQHHPVWFRLNDSVRRLQARNVLQVLGPDCETPADIVICWTPDGRDRGGTSQAIRIARAHNIPILNLGAYERLPTAAEAISHVRRTVPHWRLPRALAAETAESPNLPPARTVFPDAHHVLVTGDEDYPDLQTVSNTLEQIHDKHPNLVVNGLHGTEIGKFAAEWADLHGVRHQLIGIPRAGDLVGFDRIEARLPDQTSSPSTTSLSDGLFAIARRQHAIRNLNPRGIVSFGEHPYQTQPYQQVAADHQIPLWSFDRDGAGTTYRSGDVPAPEQPVPARLLTYAGIGATNAPAEARGLMTQIATELAGQDFLLRSGGAQGSEEAFELGAIAAQGNRRVYLPAGGLPAGTYRGQEPGLADATAPIPERAYEFAAARHENWDSLADATRRQYARNAVEILGEDLSTPADVVICWTRDGKDTGVTAQALALAREHDIPVINLGAADAPPSVEAVMDELRTSVLPAQKSIDSLAEDNARERAASQLPSPAEYSATDLAEFRHSSETLRYGNRHFNRLVEILGPDATQLSDYRSRVAWGLANVIHYRHTKLEGYLEKRLTRQPSYAATPEYQSLKTTLGELGSISESTKRHYSEGLGLGPWNPPLRKPGHDAGYAETQAVSLLERIGRNDTERHRPANARVLVDGADRLDAGDTDRLDRFLTRVRDHYLKNENRDITIVHKTPKADVLRTWCELNGVHQYVHHIDFDRFTETKKNDAPIIRDREMIESVPPDRYIDVRTPGGKNYVRRHVEEYNRRAAQSGERPIKITVADATAPRAPAPERTVAEPAPAPAERRPTPELASSHAVDAEPPAPVPESPRRAVPDNIVSIHPVNNPLRFYSKSPGGADVLSNFAPSPIRIDSMEWASVEHFYQAEKFGAVRTGEAEQAWRSIRETNHPAETRSLGRSAPSVQHWDDRKVGVMAEALCAKFRPGTPAAEFLLGTGTRPLVHHAPWEGNNPFWSADANGHGENVLGRMLEHCRDELRAGRSASIETFDHALSPLYVADPAEERATDYHGALELYDQSYQAWTQSYLGGEDRVSEEHSARTTELGEAIGRAAKHFNANFARYEPHLAGLDISRDSLVARERTLDVETSRTRAQSQQHQRSAMRV